MHPVEIEAVLSSLRILVDTREQDTERFQRRCRAFGVPTEWAVLDYGDYCAAVTLPDGQRFPPEGQRLHPLCVVERKMNLDELAECFTRGRDRFRREFQRAQAHGATVYLVVENGSWEALLAGRYRSRMAPKAFLGSLCAYIVRYGLHVVFCDELTTPTLIREILLRDMKERLAHEEDGQWAGRLAEAP